MNEQHPHDLEASVRHRAAQFEYPPTPDLAKALRQQTRHTATRHGHHARLRYVVVAIAFAALLLWPLAAPLRAAVERLWRIGAVEIIVATPVPMTAARETATPMHDLTPSLTQARIEGQTTLAEAKERVPFRIRLPAYPADLGPPDQVFVQNINDTTVIMVWLEPGSEQPFLSLQALNTDMVARKLLFADDQSQHTMVNGEPAVWIDMPHVFEYVVPDGQPQLQEGRIVQGNVLIWAADTLTYRLESSLSLTEARRVAESLR